MYHPTPQPTPPPPPPLVSLMFGGELPPASDPEGRAVREYFVNDWRKTKEGFLTRTHLIRVEPLPPEGPRSFTFMIDRPYKRRQPSGEITLDPGPVEGVICFHASVLRPPRDTRPVVAFVTSENFFHPNFGRKHHVLCLGDLPRQPLPLAMLLEHIYGIACYQNLGFDSPLDPEAAQYFATSPDAFQGLRPVQPLY